MKKAPDADVLPFGENGWIATFAKTKDAVSLALFANAVAHGLRHRKDIKDAVAGIDSVSLRFDPFMADAALIRDALEECIRQTPFEGASAPTKLIEIPICYGGDYGPDLDDLCKLNKISRDELIELHSSRPYRVLAIGFAPGFAYMGPLSPKLSAPRLSTPRQRVAAGSIGVAADFTGVYSLASPGGWNIIGRTPIKLFDADANDPFVFEAGAEVRFNPISDKEFRSLSI